MCRYTNRHNRAGHSKSPPNSSVWLADQYRSYALAVQFVRVHFGHVQILLNFVQTPLNQMQKVPGVCVRPRLQQDGGYLVMTLA